MQADRFTIKSQEAIQAALAQGARGLGLETVR